MNRNVLVAATVILVLFVGVMFAINTYVKGGNSSRVEVGSCTGTCSDEVAALCSSSVLAGCSSSTLSNVSSSCCPSGSSGTDGIDVDFKTIEREAVEFYIREYGDMGVTAKVTEWTNGIKVSIIKDKGIVKTLVYENGTFVD